MVVIVVVLKVVVVIIVVAVVVVEIVVVAVMIVVVDGSGDVFVTGCCGGAACSVDRCGSGYCSDGGNSSMVH